MSPLFLHFTYLHNTCMLSTRQQGKCRKVLNTVEKEFNDDPVKVGIGISEQEGDLLVAGAEKVFIVPPDAHLLLGHTGVAIRNDDTVIMVQPKLLKISELRKIQDGAGNLNFLCVGHEITKDLDTFYSQKGKVSRSVIKVITGRPSKVQYSLEQADAIIREWHATPKKTRVGVALTADRILGLPEGTTKPTWVRDLAIKFVGTAQRDKPENWNGIKERSE